MRVGRREVVDQLREGEANLAAGSAREEEERSYEFHCGQAAAELGLRRRGALVSSGRDGVARELCGDEAERLTGSIEGGEVRRCGFDGGLSSPAFKVEWQRVLGLLSSERATE